MLISESAGQQRQSRHGCKPCLEIRVGQQVLQNNPVRRKLDPNGLDPGGILLSGDQPQLCFKLVPGTGQCMAIL